MNPDRYDPDHLIPADQRASVDDVPMIVEHALDDADAEWHRIAQITDGDDLARAQRAEQLAEMCARRAAWWQVLTRWAYLRAAHGEETLRVFGTAANGSHCRERSDVRFWTELAADWRARAEQRPTSDAAGALSNWHDLGVTA